MGRRTTVVSTAVALGAVWLGGCASGPGQQGSPHTTVAGFARALEEHRFEDAYGFMADEYRQRVSLAEFKTALEENPEETAELADDLARVRGPAKQRATVVYDPDTSLGGSLTLEPSASGWRIVTPVARFYDQSTPRAALKAFVRALQRQRYDVVLRLMPDADKEGVTVEQMQAAWTGEAREEVERVAHNLATHLEAPIEILDDRATMPYGDGLRVQFLREGGRWKIEDPE